MSAAPCAECGTVDERGPHTAQNCLGVVKHREAQLADKLAAAEARARTSEARTLELESRFPVTACPKCGSLAKRGAPHVHGFVTGSHVKYESCDGLAV
jgi:hypothetical protein